MTDYLFIDMHMHSSFSDEDLCDETPEHILNKVQGYMDKFNQKNNANAKCCIAIADHNSMLASRECKKLLQTGKYKNVDYIPACEFTVDLQELNDNLDIERGFTRCHLLGYNFDVENEELLAYSSITHKSFGGVDNIGLQICAARRAVCEKYNTYIPYSDFMPLTTLSKNSNYRKEFFEIVETHLLQNKIKYHLDDVKLVTRPYLTDATQYLDMATSFGRIKLSEAMKLINDAGGTLVLAHPSSLKISLSAIESILTKNGLNGSQVVSELKTDKKAKALFNIKHEIGQILLEEFLKEAKVIGNGVEIKGLEAYNGVNFIHRYDKLISKVCKDNNLFETGGSDYHGENFTAHKTIGNVFQQEFQTYYGKMENRLQDRDLFVRISNLPIVDMFNGEPYSTNFKNAKFIDERFEEVNYEKVDSYVYDCLNERATAVALARQKDKEAKQARREQQNNKQRVELIGKKEIIKGINNLTSIAHAYSKILNKDISKKNRRNLVIKLEFFCQNIYEGLKTLQNNIREHADYYAPKDVKKITTLLKEVHRKYFEMLSLDDGIMDNLKEKINKELSIDELTIDKISNITIR